MIKIIFLVILTLVGFFAFRADAGGSASYFCAAKVKPGSLSVQWITPSQVPERFVSEDELESQKKAVAGFTLKALTKADNFVEVDYTTRTYRSPLGLLGECRAVDAQVKLGFQEIEVIYLDALQANECLFAEIRAHEQMHVKMYLENEEEAVRTVNSVLSWVEASADYSAQRRNHEELKGKFDSEIKPELSKIFERISEKQGAFDSPDEYLRLSSICK